VDSKRLKLLIVESEGFSAHALAKLRAYFDVELADLDRAQLLQRVAEFDIIWVRLRNKIDRQIFDCGTRLKAVVTNTTGLNHVDLVEAETRKIRIISLRGEVDFLRSIRATAELTLGLTLALLRRIPQAFEHVRQGGWDRTEFRGSEIYEKTVGIIGYGRLGRIVASYFQAMGANVLVTSRELQSGTIVDGFDVMEQTDLLSHSDIVSLHASYDPANHHMIASAQFQNMKRGAIFINTARGELVDERALLDALASGHLEGAALDVLEDELKPGGLESACVEFAKNSSRLLLTPHIGGNTVESTARTEEFLATKTCQLFSAVE
jgi:D-3-phosphoglycerate dehydrogenase / 2-oxoglutarate reductase